MNFSINRLLVFFIFVFSSHLHSKQIISFEEGNTVLAVEGLRNNKFAVGLQDGSIRIFRYDPQEKKFIRTTKKIAHTEKVSLIINLGNNLFASSSEDGIIHIWQDASYFFYPCEAILTGHTAAAYDVTAQCDNTFISRSHDDTLKLWVKDENGIYTCQVTLDDFPDIENITAMVSSSNEYNHNSGTLSLYCKDQQSRNYKIYNYLNTLSNYISKKIDEQRYCNVRSKYDPKKISAFISHSEQYSSLAGYRVEGVDNTITIEEKHCSHTEPNYLS